MIAPMTADQICRKYWVAEMKNDVDGVLDVWHKDAVFTGPDFECRGHDELRAFYSKNFENFPGLDLTVGRSFGDSNLACIEWDATHTGADGKKYRLRGVYVANTDGEVMTQVHVWFDRYPLD